MKLLVIGVPELYESRRLKAEGRRLGYPVTVSRFEGLIFEVGDGRSGTAGGTVRLGRQAIDRRFDAVYIRYFYPYISEALFLAEWASRRGLRVIDRSLVTDNFIQSKMYVSWKLAEAGLPVVPGFQAMRLDLARQRLVRRHRPMIAKGVHGSKGKFVFRLDDPAAEAAKLTEELVGFFHFQNFLDIEVEYRVLVIGGRYLGAIRKEAPSGDFRRNIALGAKPIPTDLDGRTRRLCERAARILGYEFAGIDLAVSGGRQFILEVNRSPGFAGFEAATGINVARRFLQMAAEK